MKQWFFACLCVLGFGSVVNVGLLVKIHRLEAEKRNAPKFRDGIFVETNGIVWAVEMGYPRGLVVEATNVVVKTRRGFTVTQPITPVLAK